MKPFPHLVVRSLQTLGHWVGSFVLWSVWLGLVLLLGAQLYILSASELSLPDFVLRRIEAKLEEAGVRATFGRTSFDPLGRVLVENVRLSLLAYDEPIVTARAVFVQLNPLPLLVGHFDPSEIQLMDVSAAVPAMLSPSGRAEEVVHHLDATLRPRRRAMEFQQLSARVAGVVVSARGTLVLEPRASDRAPAQTFAAFVATTFPKLCRQLLTWTEQIAQLDAPALHLEFAPSESGAATIQVFALARGGRITRPIAAEASDLRATTRLLLFGDVPPSDVELSVRELRLPDQAVLRGLHARVRGRLKLDGSQFDLREVTATTDAVTAAGVDVTAVSVEAFPRGLPRLEAYAVANVLGAPLQLHAEADVREREGVVQFRGAISPRVLDVVSERVGVNVRKFFDFTSFAAERGEARFGANLKFERLTATVRIPRLNAYGVTMEDGRALLELDPERFYSPAAYARVGDNFARGSYEHDPKTHAYRFLLEGRLKPMAISPWFREWWENFFSQLEFPERGPVASVDVRGEWRDGRQANLFVFADAEKAIIRGTPFDRVRTRLFVRPAFYDGLELLARRGEADLHGRFTYVAHPETHAWHTLELGVDSTLDLALIGQILGPLGTNTLGQFHLAQPPFLRVRGSFAGPDAPGGESEKMRIEARTKGEFRFHDFPLEDVAFVAALDRDEITVDDLSGTFGGGQVSGHARVSGAADKKRLGFDVALNDANLGQVAASLAEFFAAKKGTAPNAPGKFVQEKANVHVSFAASAAGRYDDPLSFTGDGNAALNGAEIGEVPLLGTLSELLKFTALRFTEARANFKIEGPKLVFPAVTLRGSNSAIDAHGVYALDKRELDFNAKIFPFHESDGLIKSVVGAVLSPLSNVFEVKLTGTLAKPNWAFAMGPGNLLRTLSGTNEAAKPATDAEAKSATAPSAAPPAPSDSASPSPAAAKPPSP